MSLKKGISSVCFGLLTIIVIIGTVIPRGSCVDYQDENSNPKIKCYNFKDISFKYHEDFLINKEETYLKLWFMKLLPLNEEPLPINIYISHINEGLNREFSNLLVSSTLLPNFYVTRYVLQIEHEGVSKDIVLQRTSEIVSVVYGNFKGAEQAFNLIDKKGGQKLTGGIIYVLEHKNKFLQIILNYNINHEKIAKDMALITLRSLKAK